MAGFIPLTVFTILTVLDHLRICRFTIFAPYQLYVFPFLRTYRLSMTLLTNASIEEQIAKPSRAASE